MGSRDRKVDSTFANVLTGMLVATFLVGLVALAPFEFRRILNSPDQKVALVAGIGLTLLWCVLLWRLVAAIVRQLRGVAPHAAGGLLWLSSIIVSLISVVGPVGAMTKASPVTSATIYQVVPGDSLWSIAEKQLGHGDLWSTIVNANQTGANGTRVLKDPRLIRPGWRLNLSRNPDVSRASSEPVTRRELVASDVSIPSHRSMTHSSTQSMNHGSLKSDDSSWSIGTLGALPMALIAKRRRDFLQQSRNELPEDEVDEAISELRWLDEDQIVSLMRAIGDKPAGIISHPGPIDSGAINTSHVDAPIAAVLIGAHDQHVLVAFARPGESLQLGVDDIALVDRYAVTLTQRGRCLTATTPQGALRCLALRASFDDIVIFLGTRNALDDDIAERCVTLSSGIERRGDHSEWEGQRWNLATPSPESARFVAPVDVLTRREPSDTASIRVELLRAEPIVRGLREPFTPTLRRRCVEMTAYLAVHARGPVTGDRLRTRVLGQTDDASLRTLSNTASAVRRSLGSGEFGTRLAPVTPAGLYQLRDVSCDLLEFHQLIAAAREPHACAVAVTLRRALELVHGEPLATALRGFEWFLAEGHLARLQRDGEWAALRLAAEARDGGDYDLAFWAIEQGRLIDPYSDALEAALHRVPRLREFGGNGSGGAKHESVGTG